MNIKLKYTAIGAAFGLLFPIGAIFFEIFRNDLEFTMSSIRVIHNNNPILFMIDSAPLFLGLFALFGGISKNKSVKLINEFNEIVRILSKKTVQINKNSREVCMGIKGMTDSLTQSTSNFNEIISSFDHYFLHTKEDSNYVLHKTETITDDLQSLIEYIAKIGSKNENVFSDILAFLEDVEKINMHLRKIKSIGSQINILSINSSIEANKLGQQGKSFAEIAKNIKQLADQTNEINTEISELAKNTENDINNLKERLSEEKEVINVVSDVSSSINEDVNDYISSINNIITNMNNATKMNNNQKEKLITLRDKILKLEDSKKEITGMFDHLVAMEKEIMENIKKVRVN